MLAGTFWSSHWLWGFDRLCHGWHICRPDTLFPQPHIFLPLGPLILGIVSFNDSPPSLPSCNGSFVELFAAGERSEVLQLKLTTALDLARVEDDAVSLGFESCERGGDVVLRTEGAELRDAALVGLAYGDVVMFVEVHDEADRAVSRFAWVVRVHFCMRTRKRTRQMMGFSLFG